MANRPSLPSLLKKIWERFLDYELGQLQFVRQLFEDQERQTPKWWRA